MRAAKQAGIPITATTTSAASTSKPSSEVKSSAEKTQNAEPIRRDKTKMSQYYNDWDRIDVDEMCEEIDDAALETQRREREERVAEKDRILDELALQPDGDR